MVFSICRFSISSVYFRPRNPPMHLRTSRTTVPSSYVFVTSNITCSYLNIPRSLSKTAHPLRKLPAHRNTMTRKSVSTSIPCIKPSRNFIHRLITVNIMKGEIPPPAPDTSSQEPEKTLWNSLSTSIGTQRSLGLRSTLVSSSHRQLVRTFPSSRCALLVRVFRLVYRHDARLARHQI